MKIDITDEPNRIEAEKRISEENPNNIFVPVWENERLFMVDEEEIRGKLEHYQKLLGPIWFAIQDGFVTLKVGKIVC